MKTKWILAICLLGLLAPRGFPASAAPAQALRAVRVEKGPKLDGNLDDKVWEQAVPFTDFRMAEPNPDSPPTEKTELRVIYDQDDLYLGIYCFDSEPAKVSGQTMAHDAFEDEDVSDDLVRVLLDPFQDKRNAYIFFVNARGSRSEGLAYGESFSLNWDGIWDARSRILTDGWSVEIKIPFKTISFNPSLEYWGLNVERYIPRKQEIIRLSGTTLDSFFYNAMEAARLEGIVGVKQGTGITFRPFGKMSTATDFELTSEAEQKLDGGFDLYKNFTPNLVGAFSFNTDFAETEVDERQVNLTRFPLFYPEKRTFFLEGSEIFNFGTTSGIQYHTSFIPLFSRRIGLFQESQIPILFGAKLYGKMGNTSLGFLDVQTRKFPGLGLAGNNFFAGRVYQNIWAQSKVGLIFTNGDPAGGKNGLLGFDFTYSTSRLQENKNFSAGVWGVYNWNNEEAGKPYGFGFRLAYPNDLWDVSLTYNYFGDTLNPGLGFLPRNSVQSLSSGISFSPRPGKGWVGQWIRQFNFMLEPQFYWDLNGRLETYEIMIFPLSANTERGDRIEFMVTPKRDVLPYDFEVADGVVIPKAAYNFASYGFEYSSPSYYPLSVDIGYNFGRFYSGNLREAEIGLSYKFKGYVSLALSANLVRGRLPQGNFDENVYQLKADFYLSPNLGLMNYIQYDDVSKNLGMNIRLRWQISPGNEVYLVYNKDWERRWDPLSRYRYFPLAEYGAIKVQLSIRP
jgi:hypothetical protein